MPEFLEDLLGAAALFAILWLLLIMTPLAKHRGGDHSPPRTTRGRAFMMSATASTPARSGLSRRCA